MEGGRETYRQPEREEAEDRRERSQEDAGEGEPDALLHLRSAEKAQSGKVREEDDGVRAVALSRGEEQNGLSYQ